MVWVSKKEKEEASARRCMGEMQKKPNKKQETIQAQLCYLELLNPPKRRDKYQICGHLNQLNPRFFEDKLGDFGVCVDTSPSGVLTGIHWPDKKIYQQVYID